MGLESQDILKRIRAKRRFKALVRLVIDNCKWLIQEYEDEEKENRKKWLFHIKKSMKSLLSFQSKVLLNQPFESRKEEDLMKVVNIVSCFACFRIFSQDIVLKMMKYSQYKFISSFRTIAREGQIPQNLYFLLNGDIELIANTRNYLSGKDEAIAVGEMQVGGCFGEQELISDMPWNNTFVTKSPVEVIILSRAKFFEILEKTLLPVWNSIIAGMSDLKYFDQYSIRVKKELGVSGRIKTFKANETIVEDSAEMKMWTHFVLKGECALIEHIFVVEEKMFGKQTYKLFNPIMKRQKKSQYYNIDNSFLLYQTNTSRDSDVTEYIPANVKTVFMQICTFSAKSCFCIGEPMKRRRILAITPVECLLIPQYMLNNRDTKHVWSKLKDILSKNIPSREEIFHEFLEEKKWRKYKKDLIKSLARENKVNSIHNVPYSIRIHDDFK